MGIDSRQNKSYNTYMKYYKLIGGYMAKQINVSFKENEIELELYEWIKSRLNPGSFIKEAMYQEFLIEKGEISRTISNNTTTQGQSEVKVEKTEEPIQVQEEVIQEAIIEDDEYGME